MDIQNIIILSLAFIYGLLIGSFLNVVIYRLPRGLSLIYPTRSFCPNCYSDLTFFSLIPVIGYLFQKGKCKTCQNPILKQYPIIELISAIVTTLIVWHFGLTINTLFLLIFAYGLMCLFMIDAQTQLLPDHLTIPLLWLGILFNLDGGFVSLEASVLGAVLGYLSLWLIYWIHKLLTKKEGMGYGDFKLMAMFCAWLGFEALIPMMLGSAILGIIYALITVKKNQAFAFGPFLIITGLILLAFNAN